MGVPALVCAAWAVAGCGGEAAEGDAAGGDAAIAAVESGLGPAVRVVGREYPSYTIRERMRHHGVPGASVAVIEGGRIAWARGYGAADQASGAPVTDSTLFQAASMSKPVAALAALSLVEEGRLALDEDVDRRLGSWRLPPADSFPDAVVTLRHLLTHTGGLSVHGFRGYARGEPVPTAVEVLDGSGAANSDPVRVVGEPGRAWDYSGGGYTVLQVLLEDVSGEPFATLLQDRVLAPIGMRHSTYRQPLPDSLAGQAATGHRSGGTPVAGKWHTYPEMAAAGLWTTPSDLARWVLEVQAALAGDTARVISPETAGAMLTPGPEDWGLGPVVSGAGDSLRFSHGGSNEGFRGRLVGYAEGGRGAVVMTNSDTGGPLVEEILLAVAEAYEWPGFGPKVVETVPLSASEAADYAGEYRIDGMPDYRIAIEAAADSLVITAGSERRAELIPLGENRFVMADDGTDVGAMRGPDGRVIALQVYGVRAARVEPGATE